MICEDRCLPISALTSPLFTLRNLTTLRLERTNISEDDTLKLLRELDNISKQ
jgi:hypothetical protein